DQRRLPPAIRHRLDHRARGIPRDLWYEPPMTVRQRRFVAGAGEIICWLYIYRIAAKLLGITILIALLGTPGLSASRETVTSAYLLGGAIVALLAHEQG